MVNTPVNIPRDLFSEIETYCKANDKEVTPFIVKLLRGAFTIEKYGAKPNKPIIQEEIPKNSTNEPKTDINVIEVIAEKVEEKNQEITNNIGTFDKDIYGE